MTDYLTASQQATLTGMLSQHPLNSPLIISSNNVSLIVNTIDQDSFLSNEVVYLLSATVNFLPIAAGTNSSGGAQYDAQHNTLDFFVPPNPNIPYIVGTVGHEGGHATDNWRALYQR